jgi:SAM-dependent methyltransferase
MSLNAALMLQSTIEVVRSQKRYVDREPLRSAYTRSIDIWREYYGGSLASQVRANLRRGNFRRAASEARVLLSYAPGVFFKSASRGVRAGVARVLRTPAQRRLTPVSRDFGFDRGTPIDRYYIEEFLNQHAGDIRGHVLEVKDNDYTVRFGGDRVSASDVLDVDATNPNATLIADLNCPAAIAHDSFDCIIFTQTLQLIHDLQVAVRTAHRSLRPGGVVLATMPGISQIARDGLNRWSDHWRITATGASRLFGDIFGEENVAVGTMGNLSTAVAFLQGKTVEDLSASEMQFKDPDYQLVITIRARKV